MLAETNEKQRRARIEIVYFMALLIWKVATFPDFSHTPIARMLGRNKL
jgi:hypothetical protein